LKKSEPVVFVKLSETWNRFTLNENIPASNYLIGLFDGGYCPGDKFFSIYLGAVGVILSNLTDEINDKGRALLITQAVKMLSNVLADSLSEVEGFHRYREISYDVYFPVIQGFFIEYQIGPGSRGLLKCNRFISQKGFNVAVFRAKKEGQNLPHFSFFIFV